MFGWRSKKTGLGIVIPDEEERPFIDLLIAGKKVQAIKEYRATATCVDLRQAKEYIDSLQDKYLHLL